MKRLLKGFTLAEALITLGIIGVIASVTLPSLSVNIAKQQVGPVLAKAINTLESANAMALQDGGVRTLDKLTSGGANAARYFNDVLLPYLNFQERAIEKTYYNYDMESALDVTLGNAHVTKDGITFLRITNELPQTCGNNALPITAYSCRYYTVYVDTNGNAKGPNALGKDLFELLVDTKGTVIPFGGAAYQRYMGGNILWESGCKSKTENPSNARSCAGSIVDNGYKIIYRY